MQRILTFITCLTRFCLESFHHRFVDLTKPSNTSLIVGTVTDLARSKSELVAENALLRQQLIILRRQVKRPACSKTDRMILVLLARASRAWKQALFIVQPETLLRWHRQGFKLYWKYKARAASAKPKISAEAVALIEEGQAARELAHFIAALQRIDPVGGPPPGPHNFFRGVPLAMRDPSTRAAIATLHGTLDASALTTAWEAALQVPAGHGPPVWIHGDLAPLNLLVQQGRLSAVIDFGGLGVGDPACDLIVAWNLLSAQTRDVFRAALPVDDATWARGRGWALSIGLIALPYYQRTNPILAGIARRTIDEVLADQKHAQ